MGDVVKFPTKINRSPTTEAEVLARVEDGKAKAIERAVDLAAASALGTLMQCGFAISNQYDIGLLLEVMKSSIRRSINEFHPLQIVADEIVTVINARGEKMNADGTIYNPEVVTDVTIGLEPSSNSELS